MTANVPNRFVPPNSGVPHTRAATILATLSPPHLWRTVSDVAPLLVAVARFVEDDDIPTAVALLRPQAWDTSTPPNLLHLLFMWREWQTIITILTPLVEREAHITNPADILAIRLMLGGAYTLLTDWQHALPHLEVARHRAQVLHDIHAETTALKHIGTAFLHRGDTDEALRTYSHALVLARHNTDSENERLLLNNIGVAYNSQNQVRQALVYFEEAWKIAQRSNTPAKEVLHIMNIASALTRLGDYEIAVRFVDRLLPRAQQAKQKDVIAGLQWAKAESLRELGHITEAESVGLQALALARSTGVVSVECDVLTGLANVAVVQDDAERAQVWIDETKALLETTMIPARWLAIELVQAAAWALQGKIEQARAVYNQIVVEAGSHSFVAIVGQAHLGLARLAAAAHDEKATFTELLKAYNAACTTDQSIHAVIVSSLRAHAQIWPGFIAALDTTDTVDEAVIEALRGELHLLPHL